MLYYNINIMINYKDKKYCVVTFGCQMNVHESEKIAGVLRTYGMTECEDPKQADVAILNTCAIRESAELKIESFIGNLKKSRKEKIEEQDGRYDDWCDCLACILLIVV